MLTQVSFLAILVVFLFGITQCNAILHLDNADLNGSFSGLVVTRDVV